MSIIFSDVVKFSRIVDGAPADKVGLGFRVQGLEYRVLRSRVQCVGFRV